MFPPAHAASPIRGQNGGTCAERRIRQTMSLFGDEHKAKNEESWLTGSPSATFFSEAQSKGNSFSNSSLCEAATSHPQCCCYQAGADKEEFEEGKQAIPLVGRGSALHVHMPQKNKKRYI